MRIAALALVGGLGSLGLLAAVSEGGSRTAPQEADGKATFGATAPALYIEGEPFAVTLDVQADADKATLVPADALTPASWLVDGKPLSRRGDDAALRLQPGQSLETVIDLAPLLQDRMGDDRRDFRVAYGKDADATDVIFLGLPESGIDFMALPEEQLANYQVVLETTDGVIWIELWPDVAPNHVRNFLDLCASGFYDGSPFHRVIPTFMVQGGRSKDGKPAPRKVDAEFSQRPHEAGVLSAARLGNDVNSASSEFFIVHRASRHLDGNYSAYGRVITGMDAVEGIVGGVSVHNKLVEDLMRARLPLNPRDPRLATVRDKPNPGKEILRALVVKASRTRPAGDR